MSRSSLRRSVKKLLDGDIGQLEAVRSAGQTSLEDWCGHLHYEISREAVADVLRQYASGEISGSEAQLWASFVRRGYWETSEGRLRPLDIAYQTAHEASIVEAISRLDESGDAVDGQISGEEALDLLSDLFTHPSNIQDTLEYVRGNTPDDVDKTIAFLESSHWRVENAWGGPGEPFGNLSISFSRKHDQIILLRDRGQWCLEVKMADWSSKFELGLILDAMDSREVWEHFTGNPYEVKQVPIGVSWVQRVPNVLDWLTSQTDIESKLETTKRKRWQYLYPDWEAPSSGD